VSSSTTIFTLLFRIVNPYRSYNRLVNFVCLLGTSWTSPLSTTSQFPECNGCSLRLDSRHECNRLCADNLFGAILRFGVHNPIRRHTLDSSSFSLLKDRQTPERCHVLIRVVDGCAPTYMQMYITGTASRGALYPIASVDRGDLLTIEPIRRGARLLVWESRMKLDSSRGYGSRP
jgi:hypothetical protein